jgi:Uma2 family endonuclease
MPTEMPRMLLEVRYYQAAQDYLRGLPPEHFMEAVPQATQRKITLESLDLVHARRPDVHVFNELLVQYPLPRQKRPGQVVPDNMIVVHAGTLKAEGSYDVPLQPARPFCMLEYVSKNNQRKDYDDNMDKYEHQLKVPYYLLFQPDVQELTLYRHTGRKYVSVKPNDAERLALSELELEVALLDGWVRFWFRGQLLPLPAELQRQLDDLRRERDDLRQKLDEERRARLAAEEELARLRAQAAPPKRTRNHHG